MSPYITKQWRCRVCGHVHAGNDPPDVCPVCGAKSSRFAPEPYVSNDSQCLDTSRASRDVRDIGFASANTSQFVAPGGLIEYRGGTLHFDGIHLGNVAIEHGTPSIVFSAGRIRDNLRALAVVGYSDTRRHAGTDARHVKSPSRTIRCFYSVKACYLIPVLALANELIDGVEVCSPFEYRLARTAGIPDARIGWNVVCGGDMDFEGVDPTSLAWVGVNTVEDLRRLSGHAMSTCQTQVSGGDRRQVGVHLRVRSDRVGGTYLGAGGRLGMSVEDGTALEAARMCSQLPGIVLSGLHAHTSVSMVKPDCHREALRAMLGFAVEVCRETSVRVSEINVGGGIAGRSEAGRRSESGGLATAWAPQEFLEVLRQEIVSFLWPIDLVIEPGRMVVDDAAVGLTRVLGTIRSADTLWWFVDAGSHVFLPFEGREFPPVPVVQAAPLAEVKVSIGDRLSTYSGVLARAISLLTSANAENARGTLLAMPEVGAYTLSVAQQFMFGLPTVLWAEGQSVCVLRARETCEQWVQRVGGIAEGSTPTVADNT